MLKAFLTFEGLGNIVLHGAASLFSSLFHPQKYNKNLEPSDSTEQY